MSLQTSYGKGPHSLLWAGSRPARGKITVSGIPNLLNYCVIYMVYTQFTNVAVGHLIFMAYSTQYFSNWFIGKTLPFQSPVFGKRLHWQ
jgi:hypothetical protein